MERGPSSTSRRRLCRGECLVLPPTSQTWHEQTTFPRRLCESSSLFDSKRHTFHLLPESLQSSTCSSARLLELQRFTTRVKSGPHPFPTQMEWGHGLLSLLETFELSPLPTQIHQSMSFYIQDCRGYYSASRATWQHVTQEDGRLGCSWNVSPHGYPWRSAVTSRRSFLQGSSFHTAPPYPGQNHRASPHCHGSRGEDESKATVALVRFRRFPSYQDILPGEISLPTLPSRRR